MARLDDLKRFYELMDNIQGRQRLGDCGPATVPRMGGVYFFFEEGEDRKDSGDGKRVVRVGESGDLYKRIVRKHKGPADSMGSGVFRNWVHNALFRKYHDTEFEDWPNIREVRRLQRRIAALNAKQKRRLGRLTSDYMWPMHVLFVPVDERSRRLSIEKNAIKLLSNYRKDPIDRPSGRWLGRHSCSEEIKRSGLWNSNHVSGEHDPKFLKRLAKYVDKASG